MRRSWLILDRRQQLTLGVAKIRMSKEKSILLLGKTGLLAQAMALVAREQGYQVFTLSRQQGQDLTTTKAESYLREAIERIQPNLIMNATGITDLNYCENNSIIDLISNGPSIEYILESNNTNHTYHSDFFIENLNLIIEIKSTYTYNIHLDKNLMKKKYSKLNGYNFIFIIDKDYTEFENIINHLKNKNPLN